MHQVALVEQEFGKIGAVLAGDAADQCNAFSHDEDGFGIAFETPRRLVAISLPKASFSDQFGMSMDKGPD
jgi:hypothetical protein